MADSRLLMALCLSLLISSTAISLVTGGAAAQFGEGALYVPVSSNFSDGSDKVPYSIDVMSMGNWRESSSGLVSDTEGENKVFFISRWPQNAKYVNTYRVNNPDSREYTLIARETTLFSDTIGVRVTYGGVYVESNQLAGYRPYQVFLPYGVPVDGPYDITVELDEPGKTVAVFINGVPIGIAGEIPEDSILSLGYVRYAGISVVGSGFALLELTSTGQVLNQSAFDVWAFLGSLGGVLGWFSDSGVPVVDLFINIIIKIQQFGIVVVAITIIRGN